MPNNHFDHIILGTGQAAGTLLGRLIPTGDSIAIIEKAKVGGSCVNYGCTPTKTMVASARAIHLARRGDVFGFQAESISLNYAAVRERMNRIRNNSREGLKDWMKETENVTFVRGKGVFKDAHTIQVGEQQLKGSKIYINTGTRPRVPDIEGIEQVPWMDSARLLEKESLPKHLIILGGGYIGTEFSQVFRRFGSEVTIVQRGEQLMPREDADVAEASQEFLEEEGVKVICGAEAQSVAKENKEIHLNIQVGGKKRTLIGSDLLIAAGRLPNSKEMGLEKAGIKTRDHGYIQVDDYCRTNVKGIFALGDVNGEGAFTHTSVNDAEIVLDYLFGGERALSKRIPIYALFTDPPLGRVGMSEKEALAAGKKVLKAVRPMSKISRAKEMGETRGFAKLLVDGDTDLILGASILGVSGDEVINMFAAIMHSGIPCRDYRRVVLVHPTISELMPFVLDDIQRAGEAEEEKEDE